jgi:hypothetical protein
VECAVPEYMWIALTVFAYAAAVAAIRVAFFP